MTSIEFNALVNELDSHAQQTMNKKGPEYTVGDEDVLNNFKSTAKKLGVDPLVVWYAYFDKQCSSIAAHVKDDKLQQAEPMICLLYTSPSPRDKRQSRMPSSA